MSKQLPKVRKPRKDCRYGPDEMDVINKYKEEYRAQTTRELRGHVFKTKILVDLFNLWLAQGKAPEREEDSAREMKVLAYWVQNNWRPHSTAWETKVNCKVSAINVIWETHKEAVEAELMDILGVDHLDPKHPGYFQQRNAAAKHVLERMTARERAKLDAIVKDRRSNGHPDNIRRERAERYRDKFMRTWSKERWLDMGMATVTFTVHTDRQGRLIGDVHDEVLADLGLTGTRFTVKYQDQVIAMTRAFLDFMKSLRLRAPEAVNPVTRTAVGTDVEAWSEPNSDVEADETTCDIKLTDEGFPVLPIAIIKRELTKSECERLVRAYLSHHYFLASGKNSNRVPYAALAKDTSAFVTEGSVPVGFVLKDPRNMNRDAVKTVLRHWYERQEQTGPESAFSFQLFMGPKRRRMFAEYPPRHAPAKPANKKGKQKKVQQLDNLLPISPNGTPDPIGTQIENNVGMGKDTEFNPENNLDDIASKSSHQQNVGDALVNDPRRIRGDVVRIEMGQMAELRKLGHQVPGPINGPNEGLPQYEVPREWLEQLQITGISNPEPTPTPIPDPIPSARPYPRPRPILERPQNTIDPALVEQTLVDNTSATDHVQRNVTPVPRDNPASQVATGTARPGTPTVIPTVLGKRTTLLRSPPSKRQTHTTQKRKIVTGDDLAMQEAQKLMKEGVRTRRTRKRE